VFADGFRPGAVTAICGEGRDDYAVLDEHDSLVRKSLITLERPEGRTRYGMWETIRQFVEEHLAVWPTPIACGIVMRRLRDFQ
jgi:predicted ATPase